MNPPKIPSLQPVLSFQSLDQAHYFATGEHLPSGDGSACPHPAEYYIKKTIERQQRQRAYELYANGPTHIFKSDFKPIPVKAGCVNDISFTAVQRGLNREIFLLNGAERVMILWPDGREHVEPTPVHSGTATPVRRFQLQPPPPPAAVTQEQQSSSRLRKNFLRFLTELSMEALLLEQEEWKEEMERAREHMIAVEEEMKRRMEN